MIGGISHEVYSEMIGVTHPWGLDRANEVAARICNTLGIDPCRVAKFNIEFDCQSLPVMTVERLVYSQDLLDVERILSAAQLKVSEAIKDHFAA